MEFVERNVALWIAPRRGRHGHVWLQQCDLDIGVVCQGVVIDDLDIDGERMFVLDHHSLAESDDVSSKDSGLRTSAFGHAICCSHFLVYATEADEIFVRQRHSQFVLKVKQSIYLTINLTSFQSYLANETAIYYDGALRWKNYLTRDVFGANFEEAGTGLARNNFVHEASQKRSYKNSEDVNGSTRDQSVGVTKIIRANCFPFVPLKNKEFGLSFTAS